MLYDMLWNDVNDMFISGGKSQVIEEYVQCDYYLIKLCLFIYRCIQGDLEGCSSKVNSVGREG